MQMRIIEFWRSRRRAWGVVDLRPSSNVELFKRRTYANDQNPSFELIYIRFGTWKVPSVGCGNVRSFETTNVHTKMDKGIILE